MKTRDSEIAPLCHLDARRDLRSEWSEISRCTRNDKRFVIPLLILLLVAGIKGYAHESRPLFIELTESAPGIFQLEYKVPGTILEFNSPVVILAEQLKALDQLTTYHTTDGFLKKQRFQLKGVFQGSAVQIRYPVMNPAVSTIIRVSLLNGQKFNQLLGPDVMTWTVPQEESRFDMAGQYTMLGIQHILEGWDHLLFLICLIMVTGTGKRMLITITGFTLAHSITLVMSTLNIINLPVAPVEAVIALSVVYLASEIAQGNKSSLTYQYPIAVSSSFGLLHGFGFAAVLNDIGLPQTEVPVSLFFFNVGVEIGQIIFLLVVIIGGRIVVKLVHRIELLSQFKRLKWEKMTAYGVGSLASFWMIERLWGFL